MKIWGINFNEKGKKYKDSKGHIWSVDYSDLYNQDNDMIREIYNMRVILTMEFTPLDEKWTEEEKSLSKLFKGKWIARDANGGLYTYTDKPLKDARFWNSDFDFYNCTVVEYLFPNIKWEDEEPTLLADIR